MTAMSFFALILTGRAIFSYGLHLPTVKSSDELPSK
ncbi:hypothetical protein OROMI_007978 [Orobanche minor]